MSKRTVVALAAAAAAGFAAGVLLAPKSGKDTRDELRRKALEAKDYADEASGKLQHAARRGYTSLKSGADDITGEIDEFVGHAKASGDKLTHEAKTRGKRVAAKAEATKRKVRRQAEEDLG